MVKHRGMVVILSSPSGAGKTTLAQRILQQEDLSFSISVTTRNPREGEVDGVDYHFVSPQEFHEKKGRQEFLEYAEVYDHYYATPAQPVLSRIERGFDVLLDVDCKGAYDVRKILGNDVLSVFILPPSLAVLEQRLITRGLDDQAVIERRMQQAMETISHASEYDYVLVNKDFDACYSDLASIIRAERYRTHRRKNMLSRFI